MSSAGIASLRAYDVVSRLKRQTISSSMAAGNLKQVSASTFGIPIARTAGFRPFATFRISRRPLQFDQTPTRRPRPEIASVLDRATIHLLPFVRREAGFAERAYGPRRPHRGNSRRGLPGGYRGGYGDMIRSPHINPPALPAASPACPGRTVWPSFLDRRDEVLSAERAPVGAQGHPSSAGPTSTSASSRPATCDAVGLTALGEQVAIEGIIARIGEQRLSTIAPLRHMMGKAGTVMCERRAMVQLLTILCNLYHVPVIPW